MSFSCAVCQELVTKNPEGPLPHGTEQEEVEIVALTCGHVFHKICIETWFDNSERDECAVCKEYTDDMIRLYPNGTGEREDIDKQLQELSNKNRHLEELKTKAETDLAEARQEVKEAEIKQSLSEIAQMDRDAHNKSLLAICLMELEAALNLQTQ